jgi:hypothetical protein
VGLARREAVSLEGYRQQQLRARRFEAVRARDLGRLSHEVFACCSSITAHERLSV